jgi:hypothetical protein
MSKTARMGFVIVLQLHLTPASEAAAAMVASWLVAPTVPCTFKDKEKTLR